MTGALETRLGDLERVTETVEVKLSRLRRGSASTVSSASTDASGRKSSYFKKRRAPASSEGLLQNRYGMRPKYGS